MTTLNQMLVFSTDRPLHGDSQYREALKRIRDIGTDGIADPRAPGTDFVTQQARLKHVIRAPRILKFARLGDEAHCR